jgi:peptidoglycan lytic transglycosylase D
LREVVAVRTFTKCSLAVVAVIVFALLGVTGCRSTSPSQGRAPAQAAASTEGTPGQPAVSQAAPDQAGAATASGSPGPQEESAGEDEGTDTTDEDQSKDPQATQQAALESCQSAAEFIDQGDQEDAIAALDHAYELMLSLPENGDPDALQAKEDIRRMVADLIRRTYASQRVAEAKSVTPLDLSMPIVNNDHVRREIKSFTTVERDEFLEGYRRSGLFRPMILAKLKKADLPSQLSWLPLVESLFKDRALSRASALGLWQFIASTGLRYGLTRDAWKDERLDPVKSTDAAIAYLTELHGIFGDWPKVLAAYNCGEAQVQRLQNRRANEYLDFWDLYQMLPQETRRYVPRFIAALLIIENPKKYGMTLPDPLPPGPEWTTVTTSRPVRLDALDEALGLAKGTLRELNPELRYAATPPQPYELKVPKAKSELVTASVAQLPEWTPPTPQRFTHRIRRGETLSAIARHYGTSISAIMRANRIRSANRIWPGQRLEIPIRGVVVAAPAYDPTEGTHSVRPGESLASIARRYSTTIDALMKANGLTSDTIYPGQRLKVRPGSRDDLDRYRVRRGDTLAEIARQHRVSLVSLLRANGLSRRSTIYPGQSLVIPE